MMDDYNQMSPAQHNNITDQLMEPKVTNLVETNPLAVFKAVKDFMFSDHH